MFFIYRIVDSAKYILQDELPCASLLTILLEKLGTSQHKALELQPMLKSNIRRLNIIPEVYSKH